MSNLQARNLPGPKAKKVTLSKAQRIILENMRDGNTEILHYMVGRFIYTRLDDPELTKHNRSKITLPTFNALRNNGFIKRERTEIFHSRAYHYYRITDAGIAALNATSTGAALPADFTARTPNPLAGLEAKIAESKAVKCSVVRIPSGVMCACGGELHSDGVHYICETSGNTLMKRRATEIAKDNEAERVASEAAHERLTAPDAPIKYVTLVATQHIDQRRLLDRTYYTPPARITPDLATALTEAERDHAQEQRDQRGYAGGY